jgi:PAS domain S-box-containing protein
MDSSMTPPAGVLGTADVLQGLGRLVDDMSNMLRAQRELLAQRGMELATEPLDNLQHFRKDLSSLQTTLGENHTELQQLRELARTTQVINSVLDLDRVLSDVIDSVIALTGAERGYLVLRNPETGALEYTIARNMLQADVNDEEYILSQTVVERVAQLGEPVVTVNAQEDPRFKGAESVFDYMLRSILCVPLKRKGEVIGVVYVDNRFRQGLFGEREQRVVYAFANQAAVAIENARLFERIRASLSEITATKAFMDNVFASIGSGVITADREELVMAVNDAAARILELERERALGQSLWAVLPTMYDGFDLAVREVRDQDRQQTIEVEPILNARGQVNLNLKLSPFKDSAQVTQGVAIVLDDLTAFKQQAATLSAVRRYMTPAMLDNIQTIDQLELGGVEREITVVYCDVRGFTSFSEARPPETVMGVINQYLSVSTDAINATEGIVDKYLGDAIVALYNTQLNPQADHPRRALAAALSIMEGMRALHDVLPHDQRLLFGIGIHTGPAILGNVGSPRRKEFTAIGDTVELAKLLQENALGGEIIASQSTVDAVRGAVSADVLPPRKLGERAGPEVIYRIMSFDPAP